MTRTFDDSELASLLAPLARANEAVAQLYPGDLADRQPVHTVYGGAQIFSAETTAKLGEAARRSLETYAPDFTALARALRLSGHQQLPESGPATRALADKLATSSTTADPATWQAWTLYERVRAKIASEAVEDYRIDFEDGYGNRKDAEEDGHAVSAAKELARGHREGLLPPFIGIRIKPLNEELRGRSLRTLDLFLTTLVSECQGALPSNFVITLPKITALEQVSALADWLDTFEQRRVLAPGSIPIELMVETTQSIFSPEGDVILPRLVKAARGRCRGAHFGTYDYTAGCNLVASQQLPGHPACDFARHIMQVSLARTGVTLSDGATAILPVAPHRAAAGTQLGAAQHAENAEAVHAAWRIHFEDVQRSLRMGFYQGWDLHPGQLPTRYAAVFAFFLEGAQAASARLTQFVDKAAQATLLGNVFDDAATGQGLLNFFLRGLGCGALTEAEALATGLTLEELRGRSFVKIMKSRGGLGS